MWNLIHQRAWIDRYVEVSLVGEVGAEPAIDATEARILELKAELRKLKGPPQDHQAAATAGGFESLSIGGPSSGD